MGNRIPGLIALDCESSAKEVNLPCTKLRRLDIRPDLVVQGGGFHLVQRRWPLAISGT